MNKPPLITPDLFARTRRADPDRVLGALFAPPPLRERLILLYAFNHELARAAEIASNPTLALIRLHWWREVVEGAARAHEIATPLRAALDAAWFDPQDLTALIDAREAETEPVPDTPALLAYLRDTAGRLARLAGKTLGADDPSLADLGTGYGIAGLLRAAPTLAGLRRTLLPPDLNRPSLLATAQTLLATPTPRAALAASLPALLARRDLTRLARGAPPRPRTLADRLAVIKAGVVGRM